MKIIASLVAGTALVLCSCGSKEPGQAGPPGADAAGQPVAGQTQAGDNAVAAVLESKGTPLAAISFELDTRPVAGQPFALKLLASATQPVPVLNLSVDPQGLTVEPASAVLELAEAGTPVAHDLKVTAAQAGLFDLRVLLSAGEGDIRTVYVVPVLVAAAN